MNNIYKKKAQEAKSEMTKSWWQKSWSLVLIGVGFICLGIAAVFASLGSGCQAGAENLNKRSQQSEQRAYDKWDNNNSEWEKATKKEKVDSDSISITSSEDGEVVELVA